MNWTQPADLRAQLGRLWQRGDLLRDALQEGAPPDAQPRFPLRLQLKTPSSADLTERLPQVRAWAAELAALDFVQVLLAIVARGWMLTPLPTLTPPARKLIAPIMQW